MSEINKKLNELAQKNSNNAAKTDPLVAAYIRPVPAKKWPLMAAVGLGITVLSGVVGWWFGQQSQPDTIATVSHAEAAPSVVEKSTVEKPIAEKFATEKTAVEVPVVSVESIATASISEEKFEPEPEPEPEPETMVAPKVAVQVKPDPKPVAATKIKEVANTTPAKVMPEKTVSAPIRPAPIVQKAVSKPTPIAVEYAEHQENPPQNVSEETASWGNDDEGLSIETVELDTKQLSKIEYDRAMKLLKQGNSKKAITHLESAIKYQPDWIQVRQKLAALYYGKTDTRKAVAVLQQGLSRDGEQPELRLTLAKLLVNESQPQAALNVLARIPKEENAAYMAMRGALSQQLKNNSMALNSYQKLVKSEPYDGRWWMGLGIALERDSNGEKAKEAYQQALLMGRVSAKSQQFIQQRLSLLSAKES
ncbi:tetratricopeptide repeat protein [Photobacterium frigidiphilum]|uniref:tetratricopeptide repeat protein n=1 Tax=Photobacterium frigidiphilum TaxID=264736 RepID=UPI003D0EA05D